MGCIYNSLLVYCINTEDDHQIQKDFRCRKTVKHKKWQQMPRWLKILATSAEKHTEERKSGWWRCGRDGMRGKKLRKKKINQKLRVIVPAQCTQLSIVQVLRASAITAQLMPLVWLQLTTRGPTRKEKNKTQEELLLSIMLTERSQGIKSIAANSISSFIHVWFLSDLQETSPFLTCCFIIFTFFS